MTEVEHKARQYDSVVVAVRAADGGRYRNDTIAALLARLDAADALRRSLDDVRRQWSAGMGDARLALDAACAAYDTACGEVRDA